MKRRKGSKCECGKRLDYITNPYLTQERRVFKRCGRLHNVEYESIDWSRNFAAGTNRAVGRKVTENAQTRTTEPHRGIET